jgi:hypothetical protein
MKDLANNDRLNDPFASLISYLVNKSFASKVGMVLRYSAHRLNSPQLNRFKTSKRMQLVYPRHSTFLRAIACTIS